MKIQYIHETNGYNFLNNRTIVIYQPSRFELEACEKKLENNEEVLISINIGIAKMHPKEKHWIKKTGRETSKKNMKIVKFFVDSIVKHKGCNYYHLFSEDGRVVDLKLSKDKVNAFITRYGDL